MSRVFQSLISLLLLLSVNAVANGTNDVMAKAATDFAGNFVSGIIPILVLVAIISIGLSMAQKKPEILAYGCGTIFLIGLVLVIIDFVKAHSNFFITAGFVVLIVVILSLFASKGENVESNSENISHEKTNSSESRDTPSAKESESLRSSFISEESTQSESLNLATDPLHVYPATYEDVVGKVPSATEIAGKIGEDDVSKAVWTACQFDGRYYKILRNVYVPVLGGYSEIDVLLLHETGVYVFESKNVVGSIYGDENHPQWQRYKSKNEKDFIPNPVMQNDGHIKALCEFLQLNKYQFRVFSIIVFGVKAKLKAVPENTSLMAIYGVYNLETDLVKKMMAEKVFYNAETIDSWCRKLLPYTQLSDDEKKAHNEKVSQKFHKIN